MEPIYISSESTVKPLAIEVGKRTVWLRKNIVQENRETPGGETMKVWVYDEAKMTPQEFNEWTGLLMAENAIKGTKDSENIVQLIAGQETGDGNQLAIMEAIADLYDAVATIGG